MACTFYIRCVDVRKCFSYSSSCKISKKWFLGIHPLKNAHCVVHCGFLKKKPLYNLDWDLADYQWKNPSVGGNDKHLEFFQYSVKLGRNLVVAIKV